jgi:alanine dehydrogenase
MAEEVLVLTNADMEGLLTIHECIDAVETAFRQLGQNVARTIPRSRIYLPLDGAGPGDTYYWFNNIPGAVPAFNTMALRIDSAQVRIREVAGLRRMEWPGDFAGLVLLFRLDTRELYGIVHDHYLSPLRVAATTAIGAKYLARSDARVLGLFGAGEQAKAKLLAACAVRPVERVKLYITTAERRRQAAAELARLAGVEVEPVGHPREAVEGCDMVFCATNSNDPVFDGTWLQPGTHVVHNIGSDFFVKRQEIDEETVRRAGVVVVNLKQQVALDEQPALVNAIRRGYLAWADIHELGELVIRKIHGRSNDYEITLHDNNVGMGIQFAAVGALVVEKARAQGRGTRLPLDLFMTRREGVYAP